MQFFAPLMAVSTISALAGCQFDNAKSEFVKPPVSSEGYDEQFATSIIGLRDWKVHQFDYGRKESLWVIEDCAFQTTRNIVFVREDSSTPEKSYDLSQVVEDLREGLALEQRTAEPVQIEKMMLAAGAAAWASPHPPNWTRCNRLEERAVLQ